MNVSRRFFIGGLAGFGLNRLFAAAPGVFTDGQPALTFGVLSDVHVSLAKGGEKLAKGYDTATLVHAFEWFRDRKVDAVVIAGDMAHCGLLGELKAVADAWFKVFPGDRAPDGRKVERVFVFGNHDWSGTKRGKPIYGEAPYADQVLANDPKKCWDACFHEEWKPIFKKEVKGFPFVGAHWSKGGDCNGRCESFVAGLGDFYQSIKGELDAARPFFHVQHPHPRGTVHGPVWGQDDGDSVKALSAFPNAISFSGHSHTSLTDERFIWQGAFTSVGTATLRNVGIGGGILRPKGGYENYTTPSGKTSKELDALKTMPPLDRGSCRQGQLVRVYADRVVFSRMEFLTDASLGDDIVLPLPAAKHRPFEFAARQAKALAPAFAKGAALALSAKKARNRGAKKGEPKKDVLEIVIPPAEAVASARTWEYEITVAGASGEPAVFGVIARGFRFGPTDRRVKESTPCRLAFDRLPPKPLSVSVRAVSCWGRTSEPLKGTFV